MCVPIPCANWVCLSVYYSPVRTQQQPVMYVMRSRSDHSRMFFLLVCVCLFVPLVYCSFLLPLLTANHTPHRIKPAAVVATAGSAAAATAPAATTATVVLRRHRARRLHSLFRTCSVCWFVWFVCLFVCSFVCLLLRTPSLHCVFLSLFLSLSALSSLARRPKSLLGPVRPCMRCRSQPQRKRNDDNINRQTDTQLQLLLLLAAAAAVREEL